MLHFSNKILINTLSSHATYCHSSLLTISNQVISHHPSFSVQKHHKGLQMSATVKTNDTEAKAIRRRLVNVVSYFTDEYSMLGRPVFAWILHRLAELRKTIHITNEDNVVIHLDTKKSEGISAMNCSTNHKR